MFKISNLEINLNSKPIILPEIGINHNGSLETAFKIVDSAKRAGAKIIKHQTHIPSDEMSEEAKKIKPGNSNRNIYNIIRSSCLSEEEEYKLLKYTKLKKMVFISTPFSRQAVDRLVKFNIPAFKIGSGEMSNLPLLEYICKFKKPLIVSTGMHSLNEVTKTYNFLKKRNIKFAFLHTTNLYPTKDKHLRLNSIVEMKKKFFNIPIGLSDHTPDLLSSIIGITLGAKIIEKHFVHSKKLAGPDIPASIDEKQLKNLIEVSGRVHDQLKGNKNRLKQEQVTRNFAYSSVISLRNIKKGEKFSKNNLWVKRPGTGYFNSNKLKKLYGKIAKNDIKANFQIKKKDVK
tara:strand:+ start:531 stop:1562 length:1032 start_codon:yes stop_codon:yes gene_type:complete